MIRFTVSRFNPDGDSLSGVVKGSTAPVKPRLTEASGVLEVEVSAEEAIAVTLIDIRQALRRILQKLETAYPDQD